VSTWVFQHKRRKEVERKDFKGRSQIEGLNQILAIFEDSYQFITAQQSTAEEVARSGWEKATAWLDQ